MADHWIKVEKSTPDKPEVLQIASILEIDDPDTVTGKLVRVWAWFDSNSENGHAPSVTNVLLDRLTGVTGFCDAMITVGWMDKTEEGVQVPNYDRHLGKSAKKRGLDAERKRKSRDTSRAEPDKIGTKKGLDKIREDKNKEVRQQQASPAIPYQKIADMFNEYIGDDFPKIRGVNTDKRKRITKKFYIYMDRDLDKIAAYFGYFGSHAGDFYRGKQDGSSWTANYEYIIKDETIEKCREGNL